MSNSKWRLRLKRLGLLSAMALTSLNVWTGSPLLGLWVGSRVQGSGPPTMGAIAVVTLVIAVASATLLRILNRINNAYDKLMNRKHRKRQSQWLRSLRGEREDFHDPERDQLSAVERVAVGMVLVVVVAFEVWFFFFSSSSIDQRSGRD
ncbi:MAG: hypothetical protein QOH76_370 [Thermoleophilaceae bacterium]|nr:hypothetical protein [Thermoleophilaceae bacterium]